MSFLPHNSKWFPLCVVFFLTAIGRQLGLTAADSPNPKSDSKLALAANTPEVIPAPPAVTGENKIQAARYIGAGSCAARACHGSPVLTRRGESNSAFAIFIANDPHAQAYEVLDTPESQQMAKALGLGDSKDAAKKSDRCLACHSIPVTGAHSSDALGDVSSLVSDGVSCEACHGPAEFYLRAHTERGWEALGDARFQPKYGMKDASDIAARAKVCVGCHVGEPDADGRPWRDVNHDLIAAGHPRLNFDFAAYMATLPPHWNVHKNPQRFDELRSWIIGQFTSADAALTLLHSRAEAAKKQAAEPADSKNANSQLVAASWPELSEYDCFSCHHELRGKSWRQQLKQPAGNPLQPADANLVDRPAPRRGSPGWGTWYFETPRILAATAALTPQSQGNAWLNSLNQLTSLMQTPLPIPAKVADQAADCAAKLNAFRSAARGIEASASGAADSQALRAALLKSLADEFHRRRPSDWDEFVQYYLSLVALERSQEQSRQPAKNDGVTDPSQKRIADLLQIIRNRLSFPTDDRGSASAGGENPAGKSSALANSTTAAPSSILRVLRSGFNSPLEFDPDAKQADAAPNDPAGKSLVELFDEAFQLLSTSFSPT